MSILAGAAIAAGSTLLGGLLGMKNTRDTNQANRELLDYQNKYNSPSQQIARLQQAGLNPLMASNLGGGQSASAIPMQSPDSSFLSQAGQNAVNTYMQQLNLDNELKNSETNRSKTKEETKALQISNEFEPNLKRGLINELGVRINFAQYETELTKEKISEVRTNVERLAAERDKVFSQIDQLKAQIASLDADTQLKLKQLVYSDKMYKSQLAQIASQTGLTNAQIQQVRETIKLTLANTDSVVIANEIADITKYDVMRQAHLDTKTKESVKNMTINAEKVVNAGQATAETMAPCTQVMSSIGSLLGGASNIVTKLIK